MKTHRQERSPLTGPTWPTNLRRPGILALTGALLLVTFAHIPPASADTVSHSKSPTLQQLPLFLNPGPGAQSLRLDDGAVSFNRAGTSLGFTNAGDPYNPDKYFVTDQQTTGDTPLLQELTGLPGTPTKMDSGSQLSADGMTFVATFKWENGTDQSTCNPVSAAKTYYPKQQIVAWRRSTPKGTFGQPELVSEDALLDPDPCAGVLYPPGEEPSSQNPLLGVGGDWKSSWPSVSADGTQIAYVSQATNLGVAPDVTGRAALYVRTGDDPPAMVTPANINGDVTEAAISADGDHIVFASTATNLGPTVPADTSQVYLATRGDPSWSFELVSQNDAHDPSDADASTSSDSPGSHGLAISEDGRRVAFDSIATNLQPAVEPSSYQVTALRDIVSAKTRLVPSGSSSSSALDIGSHPGRPALSLNGKRLVLMARPAEGGSEATRALRVYDAGALLSPDPSQARTAYAGYRPDTDGGGWVAIGGDHDPQETGGAASYVVGFPSNNGPVKRYAGSRSTIYLAGGSGIGAETSSAWHGDPVGVSTGNFRQAVTDLSAPSQDLGGDLSRVYDSFGQSSGMFGAGWMTSLDARLEHNDSEHEAILYEPTGRILQFLETTTGGWVNLQGSSLTLTEATSGSWKVSSPDGSSRTFDEAGHLVQMASPNIDPTSISWTGDVPDQMVTGTGYTLTFTDDTTYDEYGPSENPDGFVDRVTTSDGREITYTYQHPTHSPTALVGVTAVHRVGQDTATYGTTTYEVLGSLITKVSEKVDATRSKTIVQNAYDNWGRIRTQVNHTGDTLHFAYNQKPLGPVHGATEPAEGYTMVTNDASGDVTVYKSDDLGAVQSVTDTTDHSTSSTWAGDRPATSVTRTGVATTYTYDAASRVLTTSETAGGVTRLINTVTYVTPASSADALTDNRLATSTDAANVTTTYTYAGDARQPATVSTPCDGASLSTDLSCPSSGMATTTFTYFTGDQAALVKDQIDPDGVKTSYTYDTENQVSSITRYPATGIELVTGIETIRPGDTGWTITNPAASRAVKTTSSGGAVSWQIYDAQDREIESRDPLYNGTSHLATITTYRLDGSTASVTDPAGHTTTFDVRRAGDSGWSEASNISEVDLVMDPDGISTISKVDKSGDVVIEQHGNLATPSTLATTTHTYGDLGRLTTTVGPDGVKTTYHYDNDGRVTGVTRGPNGSDTAFTASTEFNSRGETTATVQPLGTDPDSVARTKRTEFTYDTAGRKVAQLEGVGGPTDQQLLTGYVYDSAGRLYRTIEHRHGELNPANSQTLHDQDRVTETRFTVGGRSAQVIEPPVDAATFAWSSALSTKRITRTGYDTAGRMISSTTPDGRVTATTYDDDNRVATVTSPAGRETSFGYDAAGQRISVTTPSGFTGSGDPATVTATTSYYADGRVHTTSDPHVPVTGVADPSTRSMTYTPAGRLLVATDALGRTTAYAYDARGNRTSRTVKDDANADVVESWLFDAADRITSHTVPAPRSGATSKTTTATYDADYGWKTTVTDPVGRVETDAYYNDGTLKSRHWTLGTQPAVDAVFWINQRGFTTKTRDVQGTSARDTVYTNDRVGQRVAETTPSAGVITRGFDLAGNQTTLGYPDGAAASYTHNVDGQLLDVTVTSGGISVPFATYTYDDDGLQLTETMHAAGEATRTNTLNAAGQVTTFTEAMRKPDNSWDNYQAVMTWRADGRLGTEKINSDPTTTYGYDHAGQITSATSTADSRSWTYGTRGNRLTSVHNGTTTTYLTNPNASVAKATTGSEVVNYFYNDDGQRTVANTKVGSSTTREVTTGYNPRGLTTAVQTLTPPTSSAVLEYRSYDADGLIAQADIGGDGATKTWKYQWDTTRSIPQVIDTKAQGAIWTRATWGNSRIGYKVGTANPVWFQYDAHGSTIRQDSANTALADGPPAYTPFGQPTGAVPYIRTGYRAEFTSGDLTYLRNRDYDTASAQFTTPDPLDAVAGTTTTGNAYHYVDNDPLNNIDPLGLRPTDGHAGICAALFIGETAFFGRDVRIAAKDLAASISNSNQCQHRLATLNKCVAGGGQAWDWKHSPYYQPWACGNWVPDCASAPIEFFCDHGAVLVKAGWGVFGIATIVAGIGGGNPALAGCGIGALSGAVLGGDDVMAINASAVGGCVTGAGAASGNVALACAGGVIGNGVIATGFEPSLTQAGIGCLFAAGGAAIGTAATPGSGAVSASIVVSAAWEKVIQCALGGAATSISSSTKFGDAWEALIGCAGGTFLAATDTT